MESIESFPSHELDRYIFITILGSSDYLSKLEDRDIDVLRSLPDHNNQKFWAPSFSRLTDACDSLFGQGVNRTSTEVAKIFEKIDQMESDSLKEHYRQVKSELSDTALYHYDLIYGQVMGTQRIVHSKVDYVRLSKDLPEYVVEFYRSVCEKTVERHSELMLNTLLLDVFEIDPIAGMQK